MPEGWRIPDYLKAAITVKEEAGTRFLHCDWPHVGYVTPECHIEVTPAWQTVKVGVRARVPELKTKADEAGSFEFRYDFLDKDGKTIDVYKDWPKFEQASPAWSDLRSSCDVPAGAAYLKFWPGFINAGGTFDLTDLTVAVTTKDNAPAGAIRVVPPGAAAEPRSPDPKAVTPAGDVGAADGAVAAGRQDPAFENGGFEGNYVLVPASTSTSKAQIDGEIAAGWNDDSAWAEVSIAYARETANAQAGQSAQRMEVRSIGQGAPQLSQTVSLRKGHVYHLSAELRSATNIGGELFLRQAGAPYAIYGRAQIRISPEWHRYELYARVPVDVEARVLFVPSEPGTYWIDDVKFADVTNVTSSSQTMRQGNLFANSSFEAGLSDGWHVRVGGFDNAPLWATKAHRDPRGRIDPQTAAEGKQSVAVTIDDWSVAFFTSSLTTVSFGQTYTASVALKADRPMTVTVSLDDTSATQDVQVGTDWKRYTVSGIAQLGTQTRLRIRCVARDVGGPVTFWLDAASLEEGANATAAYRPAFPAEVSLSVPRPGSIVFDGEPAPFEVNAIGCDGKPLPQGAKLQWKVSDLSGRWTDLPPVALPTTSPLTVQPDPAAPRGVFKIRATIVDATGKALSSETECIFARLPKPRELTPEQAKASYFGTHIDFQPEKFTIARAVGARWVRMHDGTSASTWGTVEPTRDRWNFNDDGVKAAREAGLHVLGMLGGAPGWASANPVASRGYFSNWNKPDAPGAAERWEQYVSRTVEHYKPWIETWEIWNEPYINGPRDAFFPNGTPEEYADLMRRASIAARQANPQVTLIGVCGPAHDVPWLDRVLRTAGPEYYDFISFHGYGNRLQSGAKTQFGMYADSINEVQARHGTPKPLWDTEGGPNNYLSWYGEDASAARFQMTPLIQIDVAHLASGVRKFFLYTMHGDPEHRAGTHMMMEHDRSIKPAVAARAVLASLVDGAAYAGYAQPSEGIDAHAFRQTDGKLVQVCWSADPTPRTLNVPQGYAALDVLGNPIAGNAIQVAPEPIYLVQQ
ncbi:MAG TPA: hypothetical protein VGN72_18140 [Tepidisphaeraceae bacterium]|jgi:hypothetical protein|nr:hypothetical protein [Tepidisphaeraceae bacterium]